MTVYEKATNFRAHAIQFACALRAEGNATEAALFDEMCECSDEGLAALYDALKGQNDT